MFAAYSRSCSCKNVTGMIKTKFFDKLESVCCFTVLMSITSKVIMLDLCAPAYKIGFGLYKFEYLGIQDKTSLTFVHQNI